jgi:hypothetical protein
MLHLLELLGGRGADALRRAVGRLQLRMLPLESQQLVPEAVEVRVGDFWVVEDVVAVQVVVDEVPKLGDPRFVRLRLRFSYCGPLPRIPCPRPTAKLRLAASSVAPVASGYEHSLRPREACFSPSVNAACSSGDR